MRIHYVMFQVVVGGVGNVEILGQFIQGPLSFNGTVPSVDLPGSLELEGRIVALGQASSLAFTKLVQSEPARFPSDLVNAAIPLIQQYGEEVLCEVLAFSQHAPYSACEAFRNSLALIDEKHMLYLDLGPLYRFLLPPDTQTEPCQTLPGARQVGDLIVSLGSAEPKEFLSTIENHPELFSPALVNTVIGLKYIPDRLCEYISRSRDNMDEFDRIFSRYFDPPE